MSNQYKPLQPLLTWMDASAALLGFQKQHIARSYALKTREEVEIEATARTIPAVCMLLSMRSGSLPDTPENYQTAIDGYDPRFLIIHDIPFPKNYRQG
ncbi:MAG: hypothetical protein H0X37_24850 [Herpetosiphonaceae bacterium]|nr:hypothetical protein [Herpetosiphonaceae bacterium]